ncbi:Fic/DOC family [Candidatus Rhabdochlamydia oedothoracis]|uniref:Fic/DOC family n=1 Tax=Candidatus Rhabdochlamydia oedothoracis TaxID=2720720 RepID=A0ABX8V6Y0_9BACT|nr:MULTISPECIES: type II toxin-antitoxin system death-on-curing family toxin [Rhabdochlamydia]KAG6558981.1 Toxin Doc [Candidatus Rhabdochlamydia sp. W815]MCL6756064.1 type II toxin-antitoxin system death-on-curing family toxin [Candidatus Rhabdochlamydia oedothoracis]QYF48773.1 Fic/DOC family [Candidatus Rhabdochlamydia oedothoracis]
MIFITLQEVIDDHAEIICRYGGLEGIRDMGLLISALEMPKAAMLKKYLHPTIFDKAAAYLFHIICNHPFTDGNKRTGTATALAFLKINGICIEIVGKQQILALEELVVHTAEGKTSKKQIASFFKEHSQKKNRLLAK